MSVAANQPAGEREREVAVALDARVAAAVATSWPLLLATCGGVATAFFRLGAKGLWGDEVWQLFWTQQQPLAQTFLRFRAPPDLPLHFMLTQLATTFGGGAFWVRLPSALLGAATVVLLFLLGRRLFGIATGLAAALLLAVAPYHVWYAQDARPYAALAFYALLSLYFFCLLMQRPTRGAWIGFTAATTLSLYNHLFGLFPLIVEIAAAVLWTAVRWVRSRQSQREQRDAGTTLSTLLRPVSLVAVAAITALVAAFPLLGGIAGYLLRGGPGDVPALPFRLSPAYIGELFSLFGAGRGWAFWLLAVFFIAGIGAGIYRRQPFTLLALGWLALPLGILWLTQPRHIFIPRYFLFMQPVYLLVIAYGLMQAAGVVTTALSSQRPRLNARRFVTLNAALSGAVVVIVAAITFTPAWRGYWVEKINDWSAICAYLHRNTAPGDVVTGNAYTEGLMDWCFRATPGVSVAAPGSYSLRQFAGSGRDVWYILIGSASPDAPFVQRTYVKIPRAAWAQPDLRPITNDGTRFTYPQAEFPATLYYDRAKQVPHLLTFHDVHGRTINPTWPDYAQIGPAGRYDMRLGLPATAPRVLRIVMLGLAGRDLDVVADGLLVARIRPRAHSAVWVPVEVPLPRRLGADFLLELRNPGASVSAFSVVEVRYAARR